MKIWLRSDYLIEATIPWAAQAASDFAIWTIKLAPGARWSLPPAQASSNRSLYFFRGSALQVGARVIPVAQRVDLRPDVPVELEAGADEVILYTQKDFVSEVKRLTGGKGVDVVYDSVGKTTFEGSLDCLRPRGMVALFGGSSGPVPPFDLIQLSSKGSLYVTRPTLWHYIATRAELEWRAGEVLGWAASGELKLRTEFRYMLADAAQAQIDLEARKTTGKILLEP